MVLFLTTLSFVTGAIVTVYKHAIGACHLFQKYNLFHHNVSVSVFVADCGSLCDSGILYITMGVFDVFC